MHLKQGAEEKGVRHDWDYFLLFPKLSTWLLSNSWEIALLSFLLSSQYSSQLPAYQEHYGGVHVEIFKVEAEQTDAFSKWPRVCAVIINPEGQREDVGQVR